MKVHLAKQFRIAGYGTTHKLACAKGFTKGAMRTPEQFAEVPVEHRCRKCQVMFAAETKASVRRNVWDANDSGFQYADYDWSPKGDL